MKEFIKNIYKNTKRLLTGHDRVLVAVSTGLDSMALLHMLLEMNVQVAIAHVNHGQREQSKDEELFIKNFAHENNIPIFIDYFTGEFSENAARQFRYDFFERIMREHNYTALLTGHHKDDQAETVFMKILRGARLFDIKGIKEKQSFANGELIRPLLHVTKRELPMVEHFQDESNFQNDYLRNRVRNLYIPNLESENPKFAKALVDLEDEVTLANKVIYDILDTVDITNIHDFRGSGSLQRFWLQYYLEDFPELKLNKKKLIDVVNFLNKTGQTSEKLDKYHVLVKSKDNFYVKLEGILGDNTGE